MPEEPTWVVMAADGRIGRSYNGVPPKLGDKSKAPRLIMESNTAQILYLFSSRGECATVPVQQLPQISEVGEGANFYELTPFRANAEIVAGVCMPPMDEGYIFMATAQEQVKRVRIEDLPSISANTFTVMNVDENDRLIAAFVSNDGTEVMLTTAAGLAIRFNTDDVRPTGLPAGGMRGIKLQEGEDRVVAAFIPDDSAYIWTISNDGVAKISQGEEYPLQGRAGQGVITMRLPKNSKYLAAAAQGKADEQIVVIGSMGSHQTVKIGSAPHVKRGRNGGEFAVTFILGEEVAGVVSYQPKLVPPSNHLNNGVISLDLSESDEEEIYTEDEE
jgi:DNA gyrase subunit A